jgi:parvulin-like peptidyl-prolyl isomerase
MQKEFKNVSVSDKDAKDFYNKNKEKFKVPATLEARHILTKTENEAKAIIKDLDKAKDKKATFVELAKSKSVGPSGPKGGYLGKFTENQMVPEFSKAAKALNKGKYSATPVKTQFGYHVIYLEDKKPASDLAYDKVKEKIKQMVVQGKFQEHIQSKVDALKSKAKIVIK